MTTTLRIIIASTLFHVAHWLLYPMRKPRDYPNIWVSVDEVNLIVSRNKEDLAGHHAVEYVALADMDVVPKKWLDVSMSILTEQKDALIAERNLRVMYEGVISSMVMNNIGQIDDDPQDKECQN